MFDLALTLIIAAAAANGILAGASLDQSVKQLPARHRLGPTSYSAYSRAADLGNGIAWYAGIGVGAALLAVLAAVAVFFGGVATADALPVYLATGLSVLHTLVTTQAAPLNFSQRKHENNEAALALLFDRFERLQALRATLQVLTFGVLLWALVVYAR
jgi:hypothetical protein